MILRFAPLRTLNRGDHLRRVSRASSIAIGLLLAVIAATALADDREATTQQAQSGFAGTWESTFGLLTLAQDGDRVTGTYSMAGETARVEGKVSGRKLVFTYRESSVEGEGVFELAADTNSFKGTWRAAGETEWKPWTGTRTIAPTKGPKFDGLWRTTFGPMRLRSEGSEVSGSYLWRGVAPIRGKLDDAGDLHFQYEQPDGESGTGVFKLGPDGRTFAGTWKAERGTGGQGGWSATRIEPVPGRTWLIVLEANWESSLADPEYSYGQMLRSFFTRLPNVQVRHRFIHTVADFRRWSAEAAYFAEPVVLYISSHGSPAGVRLGGETLDADALSDCLKHVGALRLLHFGSCEVMAGDIPRKIASACEAGERFPISGFTKPADWAGSAIVDFTYLELVIGRGMDPEQAVQETRRMVKFADEDRGTIVGSGLKLFSPKELGGAAKETAR